MIEQEKTGRDDAGTDGNVTAKGSEQPTSTCIDWYAEGQSRTVECDGVRMTVRFVGRKGRRCRLVIEAPAGAVFRAADPRRSM